MADFAVTAGLIAAALAAPAAKPPPAPVHLVTEAVDNGVRITVVGRSATVYDARYALEVSGGAGNRSTQRGSVRLQPGKTSTMTTVTVATTPNAPWTARLKVEPAGAAPYEEVRNSF